jgi:hypothetical protein
METKMETKDLNSIGLAYLEMVEKRNIEAKKNHADTLHKNQKVLDVHSDEDEDNNDDPTDGDGDIDAADLKKLRKDADKDDKKFDKKKKSSKKDDDQDKFKAYSGDDTDGQQGAAIGEDAKYPHMMYDPKTGKEFKAETPADHEKYAKMGYTHDKPEEIDEASKEGTIRIIDLSDAHPDNRMGATEKSGFQVQRMTKGKFANQGKPYAKKAHAEKERSTGQASMQFEAKNITTDLQEGAARQAALAKGLMDYCKEIGKDHMDHKDFADHAKHVKAGNWDKARAHADDQDTEVREKIHTLAIDHLGQGAASELYGGDRVSLSKNKGDGKLHASYNESVNVDDVLALIDQGYTLDQAEAMVAEACGGGGGGGTGGPQGGLHASRKYPDDKKLLKASRKQSKAGDNDRNMANDQRSIPAKGADTAPVRPGTKQQQRDFDKAARMAKSKDKVSVAKAPWDTKESVMDRVSNMVEDIRVNIQEDRDQDQEDRNDRAGPGGKYISYFDSDNAAIKRQLELGPKGKYKNAQKRIDAHVSGKKHNPAIADMISKRNKPNSGTNVVQMKRAAKINELDKKTLGSYAKKAMDDLDTQSRFATEYEKRGMAAKSTAVQDRNFKKANRADDKHRNRKAGINTAIDKMTKEGTAKINELDKKTLGSYINKAADDVEYRAYALGAQEPTELGSVRKGRNRIKGIAKATDRLTKESVQEAAKPTGIHHPIDPTPGKEVNSKDAAGRAADIRASRNPLSMTEKEFVEMHQVPTTVDPAFDGNVAAKQTAENAKKAPIKQAKTPNTPTAMGDQKAVKSTEAPAANAGVVGESYMDKYAKYIRGEI